MQLIAVCHIKLNHNIKQVFREYKGTIDEKMRAHKIVLEGQGKRFAKEIREDLETDKSWPVWIDSKNITSQYIPSSGNLSAHVRIRVEMEADRGQIASMQDSLQNHLKNLVENLVPQVREKVMQRTSSFPSWANLRASIYNLGDEKTPQPTFETLTDHPHMAFLQELVQEENS